MRLLSMRFVADCEGILRDPSVTDESMSVDMDNDGLFSVTTQRRTFALSDKDGHGHVCETNESNGVDDPSVKERRKHLGTIFPPCDANECSIRWRYLCQLEDGEDTP